MTVATAQWIDRMADGKDHQVTDPAKIPAGLLDLTQIKSLQEEVLRLRQKNAQRKAALRDLNAAIERKCYRLANANLDRQVLLDQYEEQVRKNLQLKKRGS